VPDELAHTAQMELRSPDQSLLMKTEHSLVFQPRPGVPPGWEVHQFIPISFRLDHIIPGVNTLTLTLDEASQSLQFFVRLDG
jgi:hypothetical protein